MSPVDYTLVKNEKKPGKQARHGDYHDHYNTCFVTPYPGAGRGDFRV